MITGYVPGVYDMLHLGHLRIIEEAVARCDRVIVGVVTDDAAMAMKGRQQGTPKGDRLEAQMREIGATVRYLPYTKGVSSSVLRPRRYHRVGDSVTADVTPDPVAASGNRPSTIR